MKKQLLAIVALLATATVGHAMQAQRTFTYNDQQKWNLPIAQISAGLKVGDEFVITNIDPTVMAPNILKDATGKIWAENTKVVYPGSRGGKTLPGRGTITFKVKAIPSTQPAAGARAPVLPVAAVVSATKGQIPTSTGLAYKQGSIAEEAKLAPQTATRMPGLTVVTPSEGIYPVISTTLPSQVGPEERFAPTRTQGQRAPITPIITPTRQVGQEVSPTGRTGLMTTPAMQEGQRAAITPFTTPAPKQIGQQVQEGPMLGARTGFITKPESAGQVATGARTGFITKPESAGQVATIEAPQQVPAKTAEWSRLPVTPSTKGAVITPSVTPSSAADVADLAKSAQELKAATERAKQATEELRKKTSEAPGKRAEQQAQALNKALINADIEAIKSLLEKGEIKDVNAALQQAKLSKTLTRDFSKQTRLEEIVNLLQQTTRLEEIVNLLQQTSVKK